MDLLGDALDSGEVRDVAQGEQEAGSDLRLKAWVRLQAGSDLTPLAAQGPWLSWIWWDASDSPSLQSDLKLKALVRPESEMTEMLSGLLLDPE